MTRLALNSSFSSSMSSSWADRTLSETVPDTLEPARYIPGWSISWKTLFPAISLVQQRCLSDEIKKVQGTMGDQNTKEAVHGKVQVTGLVTSTHFLSMLRCAICKLHLERCIGQSTIITWKCHFDAYTRQNTFPLCLPILIRLCSANSVRPSH